jgi:hypothetical protein
MVLRTGCRCAAGPTQQSYIVAPVFGRRIGFHGLHGLTKEKFSRTANDDTSSKLITPRQKMQGGCPMVTEPRKDSKRRGTGSKLAFEIGSWFIQGKSSHAAGFRATRNLAFSEHLLPEPTILPAAGC